MIARVLLVEDSQAETRLLDEQVCLRDVTELEWVHTPRLALALEKLSSERFDAVLLDLALPGERGLDALMCVRECAPHVPVVVLTGIADEAVAAQALREGAQDYLVKRQTDLPVLLRSLRYSIERSRSEIALRKSEERYRFLFDHNPQPMWVFDLDTLRFLAVNNAAIRLYGYSREEFLSMTVKQIRPPEEIPQLLKDLTQPGEEPGKAGTRRHRKRDGTTIDVEVSFHDLPFAGLRARLTMVNDVTEQTLLREQLQQAQKMEAIGRLAGGVAHDFNNLLTVITGYGQMLLANLESGNAMQEDVQEILNAASRAAHLTSQLLAFSRRRVAQPRVINLNDVVRNIQTMLRRLIGEQVRIGTALAPDLLTIRADLNQMEQVIMNMVVNARDAMPNGGIVTLETANVELDEEYARTHLGVIAGPHVMFAVSDTGHGMSEEIRRQIFEPFFTTKSTEKGTGLGLSMVYGIVQQAGGHIWVYSEPNRGSTFKIYFPSAGQPEQRTEVNRGTQPSLRGTETILVVEDNPDLRVVVERLLSQEGYRVLAASGGAEALKIARAHRGRIALLLTDVVMAGLSGRELAHELAASRPSTRVLFMSGYTEMAIVQGGELPKGIHFIGKPFRPDALMRKVREVLDTAQSSSS